MSPITPAPCVAAAIATYRREAELSRLLDALQASDPPLSCGVFVADNAAAPETQAVCEAKTGTVWIPRSVNNGPGPAWNTAITRALENPRVTHVLVLDDDVVPPPATLRQLLEAMQTAQVAAAAPLLCDGKNHLWAFPEPAAKDLRTVIRRCVDPDEGHRALGEEPHAFCWATGACMLYAREVFETCGLFREDFWMLGEDLEFSMRAASATGGVFTARAIVPHLPPPPDPHSSRVSHRLKFLALLQNLSYLAFHSPHSAHLRSYLAGNFKRYARTEGFQPGTLWDGWCAFYQGALCQQPAGTSAGARLRERTKRRLTRR
jgi:GT2 family glycosyltransferase